MQAFEMIRKADESGVSGTGKVLEGIVFGDGQTVIRWCTPHTAASTAIYPDFASFKKIHIDSHPTNGTEIVWLADKIFEASIQSAFYDFGPAVVECKHIDRAIASVLGETERYKQYKDA